jgi:autotransporter-associated beta strand protein
VQEGNTILFKIDELRDPSTLVWSGTTSSVWNLAIDKNWKKGNIQDWFVTNDTVVFNDNSSVNSINLEGLISIGEMRVETTKDYTISGSGSIAGAGDLEKNGTGKLTILTQNQYTGSTIINKGTISISGLTNADAPGPLGVSPSLVVSGGKLLLTGMNSETDKNINIGVKGAEIEIDNPAGNHALNGKPSGSGAFAKTGRGKISISGANNLTGAINLKEGSVLLSSSDAIATGLGTGLISLENATLSFANGINSYDSNSNNFFIYEGDLYTIELDGRCDYSGKLTGAGTLNLMTPHVRSQLDGDLSGFTGKINVTTDGDGETFLIGNNKGLPQAAVSLSSNVEMIYKNTEDAVIEIGELTGVSGSELGADGEGSSKITWKIGGKNTSFEFAGTISNAQFKNSGAKAAILKVGSGKMTLANSNSYSGGTTIEAGNIIIKNTSGSATGSSHVTVKYKAVISGNGAITGPLTIETGGGLAPGETSTGTFTVSDSIT